MRAPPPSASAPPADFAIVSTVASASPDSAALEEYLAEGACTFCDQCGGSRCRRVIFNVSGYVFETQRRTLARYPDTLLGCPRRLRPFWDPIRKHYYLNRHHGTFQCILYYYQSGGRLYRAAEIPEDVFIRELDFYELDKAAVSAFKLRNGFLPSQAAPAQPAGELRKKLWLALEYPSTSWLAAAFAGLSFLVTCASLLSFSLESLPEFDDSVCVHVYTLVDGGGGNETETAVSETQNYTGPFFLVECGCVAWFATEALLRFLTCDSRRLYFRSVTNLFDLFAVLPFFVVLAIVVATDTCDHSKSHSHVLILLRVLRLLRSARVFKLTKHSRGMHILGLTIVHSVEELTLFFLFTAIAVTFFASAVYYADDIDTGLANMRSIPDTFWFVIVSYCTVGYGDVVPTGPVAKMVSAACIVSGVITIGLLVPFVVTNFSRFYNHEIVNRAHSRHSHFSGGCTLAK